MRWRFILSVGMTIGFAAPAAAQDRGSALPEGSRVRISSPQFHGTGVYTGSRSDTVLVVTAAGEHRALPLGGIISLDRSLGGPYPGRAMGHGALVGGAAGALSGAAFVGLLLVIVCDGGSCTGEDWVKGVGVGAGVGGGGGAVVGTVAGLVYEMARGERWGRVPLPEGLTLTVRPADIGLSIPATALIRTALHVAR
jgi:hypothetical protein